MTADVELLPLPEGEAIGCTQAWGHDQMRAYARAVSEHNVAARDAEIEALRAEVGRAVAVAQEGARLVAQAASQRDAEKARAERLAEALREAMDWNWLDDDARPSRVADLCEAALRDHDQEGK